MRDWTPAQKEAPAAERIKQNPRGFLSKDNAKRDEFSNVTRTAQWRESLGKEIRFTQKGAAAFYKNLPQPTQEDKRMKMLLRRSMSSSSVIGMRAAACTGVMLPSASAARVYSRGDCRSQTVVGAYLVVVLVAQVLTHSALTANRCCRRSPPRRLTRVARSFGLHSTAAPASSLPRWSDSAVLTDSMAGGDSGFGVRQVLPFV